MAKCRIGHFVESQAPKSAWTVEHQRCSSRLVWTALMRARCSLWQTRPRGCSKHTFIALCCLYVVFMLCLKYPSNVVNNYYSPWGQSCEQDQVLASEHPVLHVNLKRSRGLRSLSCPGPLLILFRSLLLRLLKQSFSLLQQALLV